MLLFYRVNCYNAMSVQCPFGGFKMSGNGRELWVLQLYAFSRLMIGFYIRSLKCRSCRLRKYLHKLMCWVLFSLIINVFIFISGGNMHFRNTLRSKQSPSKSQRRTHNHHITGLTFILSVTHMASDILQAFCNNQQSEVISQMCLKMFLFKFFINVLSLSLDIHLSI